MTKSNANKIVFGLKNDILTKWKYICASTVHIVYIYIYKKWYGKANKPEKEINHSS